MKQGFRYVTFLLLLSSFSAGVSAQDCDRSCLEDMLDQYLQAVVDNDPDAAPLAWGVRQTENAVNFAPGKGVWETVTALGEFQRRYFDPEASQAAYYGGVLEDGVGALTTVRIKVENGEITEGEWYVARENDPGMNGPRQPGNPPANLLNLDYLMEYGPPQRIVPEDERVDRATLERIARSYFDALTSHDRSVGLVHEGCGRGENGSPAPGGQELPPADGSPINPEGNDCLAGLEGFNLSMVVAQRYPMIDVEAQAILSYGVFIRRPGSPTSRLALSEWFFVDEGKIRTVYTTMFYPPATLALPNWPSEGGGNWPLAPGIVPSVE